MSSFLRIYRQDSAPHQLPRAKNEAKKTESWHGGAAEGSVRGAPASHRAGGPRAPRDALSSSGRALWEPHVGDGSCTGHGGERRSLILRYRGVEIGREV